MGGPRSLWPRLNLTEARSTWPRLSVFRIRPRPELSGGPGGGVGGPVYAGTPQRRDRRGPQRPARRGGAGLGRRVPHGSDTARFWRCACRVVCARVRALAARQRRRVLPGVWRRPRRLPGCGVGLLVVVCGGGGTCPGGRGGGGGGFNATLGGGLILIQWRPAPPLKKNCGPRSCWPRMHVDVHGSGPP